MTDEITRGLKKLRKKWVPIKIIRASDTGTIFAYEFEDSPGKIYFPLIENGRNVEEYKTFVEGHS